MFVGGRDRGDRCCSEYFVRGFGSGGMHGVCGRFWSVVSGGELSFMLGMGIEWGDCGWAVCRCNQS